MKKPYQLFQGRMEDMNFEENSIDVCITDPPYSLGFMGKAWDKHKSPKEFQDWFYDKALNVYRVLKPGAYFVCFGGTRTYHRMTCAIEDAGFEIRDCIMWVYGSGFPKSHNGEWGGTALKPAYEPIIISRKPIEGTVKENFSKWGTGGMDIDASRVPGEPWKWGTQTDIKGGNFNTNRPSDGDIIAKDIEGGENGRWPANIVHDGSEEVVTLFPKTDRASGKASGPTRGKMGTKGIFGSANGDMGESAFYGDTGSAARFFYCAKTSRNDRNEGCESLNQNTTQGPMAGRGQPGLKCNKCGKWKNSGNPCVCVNPEFNKSDFQRPLNGNDHPTVKPTELMRWLVRMFCPMEGICMDPFQGSGSTGKACMYENRKYIGIDMDFDIEIARARIEFALKNRDVQINIF